MSDRPTADDLLETARATVLDTLLPALPPEHHYAARMVANALAIARREHAAAPMEPSLRARLVALAHVDDPQATPDRLAIALVDRLRGGAFDDDPSAARALHEALTAWTRARLAISNPKALR